MLRTSLIRTLAAAGGAPRLQLVARRLAPSVTKLVNSPAAPRLPATAWLAVRTYASGGSLKKDEVEGRIFTLLKGFDKVNDAANIKPAAHFANDLGLDSLDTVEVVMAIEEEFSIEIPDKDADSIHSIDKAVEYILSQPDAH